MPRYLSDADMKTILRLRREGKRVSEIRARYRVGQQTLFDLFKAHGLPTRLPPRPTVMKKSRVVKLLRQGLTAAQIAAELKVKPEQVKAFIYRNDLGYLSSPWKPAQLFALELGLSYTAVKGAVSRGKITVSRHGRMLMLTPEQEAHARAYFTRHALTVPLGFVPTSFLAQRWGVTLPAVHAYLNRHRDAVQRVTVRTSCGDCAYWNEREALALRPTNTTRPRRAA